MKFQITNEQSDSSCRALVFGNFWHCWLRWTKFPSFCCWFSLVIPGFCGQLGTRSAGMGSEDLASSAEINVPKNHCRLEFSLWGRISTDRWVQKYLDWNIFCQPSADSSKESAADYQLPSIFLCRENQFTPGTTQRPFKGSDLRNVQGIECFITAVITPLGVWFRWVEFTLSVSNFACSSEHWYFTCNFQVTCKRAFSFKCLVAHQV